jgi:predicted dehydrogenase
MGRRHLRGLARLAGSPRANVELVAVCDLNQDNANFLADEAVELLGRRPQVYADLARLPSEVQAASVTTDAGSHHRVVVACLEAGLHVLSEKPLALTVRGCNLIIDAARRAGRIVSVAENYRRDPINRLARALIRDGAIGDARLMIETSIGGRNAIAITPWRHMKNTGTITVDAGIHYAVRTVFGESRLHEKVRYNTKSAGPGGFYARWSADFPDQIEPTGDDALYAHLGFESSAIGHWIDDHAGHGRPKRVREVFGSAGSLDCPGDRNGRPITLHLDDRSISDGEILDFAPSYHLDPLAAELFEAQRPWTYNFEFNSTDERILALEYFELGACIASGEQPEVTAEEGRADLALIYAPFESGLLGRAVTLAEVISLDAYTYQQDIDVALGLVPASAAGAR